MIHDSKSNSKDIKMKSNKTTKSKNVKTEDEQSPNKRKLEHDTKDGMFGGDGEKPDWKKIKLEKKEERQRRKQINSGGNEIYEISVNVKKIWEELRRDDCKDERKVQLCKELYALIKGKAKDIIYAHDTVRVIETLLSAGGEKYRTLLFHELKDDLLNLSKNKYSKFFVTKLLRYGSKEQKNAIMQAMSGHVVKIMTHKIASDVLELAYNDYANAKQRSNMIQEFFGPRFRYFKDDSINTLKKALEKYPELKESILSDVGWALQQIISKGVFTNTMIHTLLKEYLYECSETEKKTIIDNLRENLLPIVHTRDGARIAMLCLWYGSAKDKKVIAKSFKGKYVEMAVGEHSYMIVLAAFESIDESAVIKKIILPELMEGLNELLEKEHGKRVLKYMVAPRSKLFFHPDILAVLKEIDNNPNVKKELTAKYEVIHAEIAAPVLQLIRDNLQSWARDSQWTLFIGAALQSLSHETIVSVFEAIAEICAEPFIPGDQKHFLEISFMSKMITFIIRGDKTRFEQNKPIFSSILLEVAQTEMRGWTLSNRGCFILVNLVETEIPEVVEKVSEVCKSLHKKLSKSDFVGAKILLEKIK